MKHSLPVALLAVAGLAGAADTPNIDTLMDNGHWKRARQLAEALYKANPNDAHANYCLTRIRQSFGNADEAVKYGEAAVKLDPFREKVLDRWKKS